jgi:protein-S-isoprenylcysteine O-methyltransferase Ste14
MLTAGQRFVLCSDRMADGSRRSVLRAALGTALFLAVLPLPVIVLAPYALTGWHLAPPFLGTVATRWLGVVLIVVALPVFVAFNLRFVFEGLGTPAPVAPTRHLVVGGPFRWVRNPGYLGVLGLVIGQALLFGSVAVLLYAAGLALGFHLFVLLYEEPTLRRQFGPDYELYCRTVPRWLPRPPPARLSDGGVVARGSAQQ